MLKRLMTATFAAMMSSVAAVAGPAYVDTDNKFELTLPDTNWTTEKPTGAETKVMKNSRRKAQTGANCRVPTVKSKQILLWVPGRLN
jgi:hypothetical protein